MAGRYSFEDDMGERQPLDQTNQYAPRQQQYQQSYDRRYAPQSQQHYQEEPYITSPPRGSPPRAGPGSHPDSAFGRLRAQRRLSQDGPSNGGWTAGPYATAGAAAPNPYSPQEMRPQPPPHREADGRPRGREQGYPPAPQRRPTQTTPGADNFSEAAAGGMAGIAMSGEYHPNYGPSPVPLPGHKRVL
jgi:hypothetical protein